MSADNVMEPDLKLSTFSIYNCKEWKETSLERERVFGALRVTTAFSPCNTKGWAEENKGRLPRKVL